MIQLDADALTRRSRSRRPLPGDSSRATRPFAAFYQTGSLRKRSLAIRQSPVNYLPEAQKERLDHYLVRTGFAPSRRVAQELVERGLVRINGRRSKKSEIVGVDDRIEVASTNRRAVIEPNADLALEVIHEDATVIP